MRCHPVGTSGTAGATRTGTGSSQGGERAPRRGGLRTVAGFAGASGAGSGAVGRPTACSCIAPGAPACACRWACRVAWSTRTSGALPAGAAAIASDWLADEFKGAAAAAGRASGRVGAPERPGRVGAPGRADPPAPTRVGAPGRVGIPGFCPAPGPPEPGRQGWGLPTSSGRGVGRVGFPAFTGAPGRDGAPGRGWLVVASAFVHAGLETI